MTHPERELANAIRELRKALNESQQEFSDRLGVTLRTIARYELESPPRNHRILFKLRQIAIQAERLDLSRIFSNADRRLTEDLVYGAVGDNFEIESIEPEFSTIMWLRAVAGEEFQRDLDRFLMAAVEKHLKETGQKMEDDEGLMRAFRSYLVNREKSEPKTPEGPADAPHHIESDPRRKKAKARRSR